MSDRTMVDKVLAKLDGAQRAYLEQEVTTLLATEDYSPFGSEPRQPVRVGIIDVNQKQAEVHSTMPQKAQVVEVFELPRQEGQYRLIWLERGQGSESLRQQAVGEALVKVYGGKSAQAMVTAVYQEEAEADGPASQSEVELDPAEEETNE